MICCGLHGWTVCKVVSFDRIRKCIVGGNTGVEVGHEAIDGADAEESTRSMNVFADPKPFQRSTWIRCLFLELHCDGKDPDQAAYRLLSGSISHTARVALAMIDPCFTLVRPRAEQSGARQMKSGD